MTNPTPSYFVGHDGLTGFTWIFARNVARHEEKMARFGGLARRSSKAYAAAERVAAAVKGLPYAEARRIAEAVAAVGCAPEAVETKLAELV